MLAEVDVSVVSRVQALGATVTALGMAMVASVMAAPGAHAAPPDIPGAGINKSKCSDRTSPMKWWGGTEINYPFPNEVIPKGTVYVCFYKYLVKGSDKHGDYWGMVAESHWTFTGKNAGWPAATHQSIVSSRGAKDNVFDGTESYTSSKSCTETGSVSVAAGPLSFSLPIKMCKSYKISRYGLSDNSAYWKSDSAGGLRVMRTTFFQKVPEGRVPTFDVTFAVPQYKNYYDDALGHWTYSAHFAYTTFKDK